MARILQLARNTMAQRFSTMQEALDKMDFKKIKSEAHAARSTASAAGFPRLLDILTQLEDAALRGDGPYCSERLAAAAQAAAAALDAADDLLAQTAHPEAGRSRGTANR